MEKKFERIKKDILGHNYSLSIALVSPQKSRSLNKKYRKKDKAANVLSFALSDNSGEILLCPAVIRKEAKNFGKTPEEFLNFLVIHGILHLKGNVHGSRMEKAEQQYDKKYFGGHRRGVLRSASSRRRIFKGRKKS